MEQCRVCISKATLTYPFSLNPLVGKKRIQEVIHTYTVCLQVVISTPDRES